MVADIDPHVIGITKLWADEDIIDDEFVLPGCITFRKDRRQRREGAVLLNILKNQSKHMK